MTDNFLTPEGVGAALVRLRMHSQQPWGREEEMVWRSTLRRYRPGELAALMEQWEKTSHGHLRPKPGDLARFRSTEGPTLREYMPTDTEPMTEADVAAGREFFAHLEEILPRRRQREEAR